MSDRQCRVADWISPLLLSVISLALLFMPASLTSPVKSGALCLMVPVYGRVQGFLNGLRAPLAGAIFSGGRGAELERLRELVSRQEAIIAGQQDIIRRQTERMRQLAELTGTGVMPSRTAVILADVAGRDAAQGRDVVLVNVGKAHGVEKDYPALIGKIGIGRVVEVGQWASRALLVSDVASREIATIARTGDRGILEGTGGGGCILKYIPAGAEVKVGDAIVASQQARIFPPGTLLGEVTGPGKAKPGQAVHLGVRPGWDLWRLESLIILVWRPPASEFAGSTSMPWKD